VLSANRCFKKGKHSAVSYQLSASLPLKEEQLRGLKELKLWVKVY